VRRADTLRKARLRARPKHYGPLPDVIVDDEETGERQVFRITAKLMRDYLTFKQTGQTPPIAAADWHIVRALIERSIAAANALGWDGEPVHLVAKKDAK
jgi:hypothetical protein